MNYYIGVDVGTTSVRAALVSFAEGLISLEASCVEPICIWNDEPDHFEQSSVDIWNAIVITVRQALERKNVNASDIKAIGFDATCSLVALDRSFKPVSLTALNCQQKQQGDAPVITQQQEEEQQKRNVIMWMDHRAIEQTKVINDTKHGILQFVGGVMSAEMEMPKILWIKQNLKETWNRIGHLMDLPDFLTYRATGSLSRSLCSLVCKWAYDASSGSLNQHSWSDDFLMQIGLSDLIDDNHSKIGQHVLAPGEPVGQGLSESAAMELGLLPGTPVGTSLIDAHAGGIGMLTCRPRSLLNRQIRTENKLGLICGTSTCHMVVSEKACYVPGVWGPYFSAMLPGMWLNEGGQSATGKLLEHILQCHPAYAELKLHPDRHVLLSETLTRLSQHRRLPVHQLARDVHVYPDFHGNRSPLADASMRGTIYGLTLSTSIDELATLYLATLQSLVYGTKHIVEQMESKGHNITTVYVCGGLIKNLLFVQMTADILNKPVVISDESECVLLGAALAGVCAEQGRSLRQVMEDVWCDGTVYSPDTDSAPFHLNKYKIFRMMCEEQRTYRDIMSGRRL